MIGELAAQREIARRMAVEREERRKASRLRLRRLLRLAAILAALCLIMWSAWRIGYETALLRALHP